MLIKRIYIVPLAITTVIFTVPFFVLCCSQGKLIALREKQKLFQNLHVHMGIWCHKNGNVGEEELNFVHVKIAIEVESFSWPLKTWIAFLRKPCGLVFGGYLMILLVADTFKLAHIWGSWKVIGNLSGTRPRRVFQIRMVPKILTPGTWESSSWMMKSQPLCFLSLIVTFWIFVM